MTPPVVRSLSGLLLCCACARPPPAATAATAGVDIEQVRLTTWRGERLTARGTARTATLTADGFRAEGVTLELPKRESVRAPRVEGALDGRRLTASDGADAQTPDGCS